jgi:hypothetical protein
MDDKRARELRNDLTRFASRWWAGEAEVAHTFFARKRTGEEHLRWLRLQAYKEIQPRSDGVILRLVDTLKADYPQIDHSRARADYLYTIQFLEEEFRHYVLFADVIDYITGEHITPEELVPHELEGETALRALRAKLADEHGDLARFASSFCEGGGASIYYEGAQVGGSELNDRIALACQGVFDDEVDHAVHGASALTSAARTDEDWALAREMVESISRQRVRMRNEQFGFPLSDARLAEIDAGDIELSERYAEMLV